MQRDMYYARDLSMRPLARYVRSSVGAKHVMAVTGVLLALFAIQHMTGHLLMFAGRDAYNEYAHWAQNVGHGSVKWVLRIGLLVLVIAHAIAGVRLAARNRAARPVRYRVYRTAATSPWARAMVYTGLITLAFLVFHILHFTVGVVQPEFFHLRDPSHRYDAYTMFVRGFQNPAILAVYLGGMTLLMLHLRHGIASTVQSLGVEHPTYSRAIRKAGPALAVALYVGFVLPPIAVAVGVIGLAAP